MGQRPTRQHHGWVGVMPSKATITFRIGERDVPKGTTANSMDRHAATSSIGI